MTREVVENPRREMDRLLLDPSNPEMMALCENLMAQEVSALVQSLVNREDEFEKRYGMRLWDGRIRLIAHRVVEKGYDVNAVFEEVAEIKRHVEEIEREYDHRQGIRLRFEEGAVDRITELALEENGKGISVCAQLAKDFEHGLRLIRDRTGRRDFILTREAVDDPEGYLNRQIREVYSKYSDPMVERKE